MENRPHDAEGDLHPPPCLVGACGVAHPATAGDAHERPDLVAQEGDPEQGACVRHPELGHDDAGGERHGRQPEQAHRCAEGQRHRGADRQEDERGDDHGPQSVDEGQETCPAVGGAQGAGPQEVPLDGDAVAVAAGDLHDRGIARPRE